MDKSPLKVSGWQTMILGLFIVVLAVIIRWPYINLVPCWSAGNENNLALAILDGARPLTNQNPHLGALSPYLVAFFLNIFGLHSLVPRLLPFIAGVATVFLTYLLGKQSDSLKTGIFAGTLMAAAWYHIVFSSHYPWSNSLTPFFATLFLYLLHSMAKPTAAATTCQAPVKHTVKRMGLGVFAGAVFGAGMQTHPEMVTLVPVIILVLAVHRNHIFKWLLSPVPWLLLIGGMIGYGNMLYFNIIHRFKSVEFGLTYPEYALTSEYTASSISSNYFHEFLYLPRIILGLFNDNIPWSHYAIHPMILLFWILVFSGIYISIKGKKYIVPAAFLSSFLIIPAINSNYSLNLGRYLVFIFPPALILVAVALNTLLSQKRSGLFSGVFRWSALLIFCLMFLFPLFQVRSYYNYCADNGLTRERFHRFDQMIKETGLKSPLIVLDQETGEADDFHQYLKEEGYRCCYVKFRDCHGQHNALDSIKATIGKADQITDCDGVILALAMWNRHFVLNNLPAKRFLGQVDVRFEETFVDFYRLYLL